MYVQKMLLLYKAACEETGHDTRKNIQMESVIRPVGRVGNETVLLRGIQAFFACVFVTGGK
jgi:hypothetical protein